MIFSRPLLPAILVRRYKRFLADVQMPGGERVTAHCPNTGSMLGCAEPGFRVWLSRSDNPRRKYSLTWELVEPGEGVLVGINTGRANGLVREALTEGRLPQLESYERVSREVRYGNESSRVDFLLEQDGRRPCYLEVKNVTAAVHNGVALFPDAITMRGARHMRELAGMIGQGARAMVCFCVQRSDVLELRPADAIDPQYGSALREAVERGVEVVAMRARVTPRAVVLERSVPVVL